MFNPFKSYRTLGRTRHILLIVSKYGFGELMGWLKVKAWWRRTTPTGRPPVFSRGKRFRLMLEELGPTFIKFGQLLSTRSDLLPADVVEELVYLQDRVTTTPWKHMKSRFEQAGITIDQTFSQFDTTPIASASLAQVYAATLKTGEKVAVKVLRPNIEDTISADLSVLGWFASRITLHLEEAKRWEPEGLIREFRRSIYKELDMCHEGRNADIFRTNFADDPTVYVPKIYWNLSSRAILVMELIEGRRLADCFDSTTPIELRKKIAANGAQAILKQIFLHGFFQADPHPGNGFVLDDGVICFLDFGMFARVDKDSLLYLAQGLYATLNKDADRLVKAARAIGMITDESETDQLKLALIDLVDQYHGLPLKQIVLGKLLSEVVQVIRLHKLRLRSDLMMLVKSISTIESVGRNLDPDFDIIEHARPFIKEILTQQHSPGRLFDAAVNLGEDITTFIRTAPDNVLQILRKMKDGQLKIDFMHKGLESPVNELNRMFDKLILGLITSALLIASSLIVQTGKG
ncbi:MAG: AarF/ABC1/UbiB kinase family protein, partial [Sedimentisphaerales bacterium]|nr:AarF/ABC1/UbiB kinase family protein [Sedimentisphaerales bacterium]